MGYKTITQLVLFITSLVIIFTYIQPSFITIKKTQDELDEYADASDKASELNTQLSQLLGTEQSFKRIDIAALEVYLPSSIDELAIMADITAMVEKSGAKVTTLVSNDLTSSEEDSEGDVVFAGERITPDGTKHVDFDLSIETTYDSFKTMLKTFEQNKYPLEIIKLSFGDLLSKDDKVETSVDSVEGVYDIVLRTYSYSNINN